MPSFVVKAISKPMFIKICSDSVTYFHILNNNSMGRTSKNALVTLAITFVNATDALCRPARVDNTTMPSLERTRTTSPVVVAAAIPFTLRHFIKRTVAHSQPENV